MWTKIDPEPLVFEAVDGADTYRLEISTPIPANPIKRLTLKKNGGVTVDFPSKDFLKTAFLEVGALL